MSMASPPAFPSFEAMKRRINASTELLARQIILSQHSIRLSYELLGKESPRDPNR